MAEEKTAEVKEKSSSDFKIILIGLVIFLAAMGASYFLMRSLMAPLMPQEEKETKEVVTGNLVSVGEFTTNVSGVSGTRFLKVEVFIEVSEEKGSAEKIEQCMPIIKDSILTIISSKTAADLDVTYREQLKEEIKTDLNNKLGKGMIKSVYFTNFIMQ